MKTTLDIPEDLAVELRRRAAADGRDVADEVVDLVRKGLAVAMGDAPAAVVAAVPAPVIIIDPDTGLPVIQSPSDAPIWRMTAGELDAIIARSQLEEDLERAGLPVRR
jgi:plasmid stability protein